MFYIQINDRSFKRMKLETIQTKNKFSVCCLTVWLLC